MWPAGRGLLPFPPPAAAPLVLACHSVSGPFISSGCRSALAPHRRSRSAGSGSTPRRGERRRAPRRPLVPSSPADSCGAAGRRSWVTGRSGPIWPMATGANGADVRGSYGLTMLRRAQFCRSGGTGSAVWKRQAGCSGSASAPGRRRSVSCGRCRRRGGAARTWSRPRAVAAGPASRWRQAGRGLPGARLPRVSVRGRGPRGPGGSGCVVPAPSVRRAAAGRGLRARPVRGRRASW